MGRKLTTEEFIAKAKKVHGDKYDYSKADYKGTYHKITVICKLHGEFSPSPNHHLSGRGCPTCSHVHITIEDFIEKAKKVHGDKYDYSKADYKGSLHKITVICPIHGEFSQFAHHHLSGSGCTDCYHTRVTTEDFIEKAKKVHGDKYDYSKADYKGSLHKITVICKLHGEFSQLANSHLRGSGCTTCGLSRIHESADTFYIWQESGSNRYKVGITSKSLEVRMTATSRLLNITPIPILELKIDDAFSLEQSLLQIFAEDVYDGEGYGVEFLTLTEEKLEKLLHLVKQVSKNGLPEHLKIY